MEKLVFTEHHLLKAFLSMADIKVFWKDHERRFLGVSDSFLKFYGLEREDLLGKTDEEMGWHIDPDPYKNDEYQVIKTGKPVYNSVGKCIIKGQVRHIIATKLPVRDELGRIVGLVGYFRDITDQKKDTERLLNKVNTDELTGLANRSGLMDAMNEYVAEYQKMGIDFAIVVIDIDNFREINDLYGHGIGDSYLKIMADDLLKICGNTSVVARLGGDYFVILRQIPKSDKPSMLSDTILSLLDHIRLKQREVRLIGGHSFRKDTSIGWTAYSEFEDVQEALHNADQRMYSDKSGQSS